MTKKYLAYVMETGEGFANIRLFKAGADGKATDQLLSIWGVYVADDELHKQIADAVNFADSWQTYSPDNVEQVCEIHIN